MSSPLDRAVAALRGPVEKALKALKVKLPASKRASPEPFGSVEDDSASLDGLLEPNAAILGPEAGKAARKAGLPAIDFHEVLEAFFKNKALLACAGAALSFILALAVTAIIVGAPAKPIPAAANATSEGASLVRRMIVPPRSSLAPRMEMEREGAAAYTVEDAIELGIDRAEIDYAGIKARNDADADEFFGTVR